jgi:hypothetical protein
VLPQSCPGLPAQRAATSDNRVALAEMKASRISTRSCDATIERPFGSEVGMYLAE